MSIECTDIYVGFGASGVGFRAAMLGSEPLMWGSEVSFVNNGVRRLEMLGSPSLPPGSVREELFTFDPNEIFSKPG